MVYIHSQALTEPPFIFLILLGFYWIVESLEESRTWALYGASLLIGVSCLVRYVGIAFLPTGAAVILLLHRGSWKHRLSTAAKFMILGSLPFAGWVLRNLFAAGDAVNRTFGIHPPGLDDLLPALDTAGYWLLPIPVVENSPWLARPVMGILFVAIFCLAVKKKYLESRYVQAVVFCLAGYALFLFVSMSLNDQPLYFDTRTLALPYVTVMILTLSLLANWLQSFGHGRKSGFPLAIGRIIAVVLAVQMINGVAWLKQSYFDGIGFATEPWRTSELLGFAKQAPAKLTVFSNAPDFIYTLAGKPAAMIPRKVNPDNRQPNPRYDAEIDAMRAQLEESNGVIMYFGEDSRLWYLPSANELKTRLPLELFKSAADGKIYRLKTVSNSTLP